MKKFYGFEEIDVSKLGDLGKFAGVWALFGKEINNEEAKWRCLQVAETKNVVNEIEGDKKKLEASGKFKKEVFVNSYGEKLFEYYRGLNGNEYSYVYLKEYFKDFRFVLIYKCDDKQKRGLVEKYVARTTEAIVWRNVGGVIKEIEYGDEIKIENTKAEIIKRMQMEAAKDKSLSIITEKINGFLVDNYNSFTVHPISHTRIYEMEVENE